jgi:hypothetical protein
VAGRVKKILYGFHIEGGIKGKKKAKFRTTKKKTKEKKQKNQKKPCEIFKKYIF